MWKKKKMDSQVEIAMLKSLVILQVHKSHIWILIWEIEKAKL
jgi:hypothetical protein